MVAGAGAPAASAARPSTSTAIASGAAIGWRTLAPTSTVCRAPLRILLSMPVVCLDDTLHQTVADNVGAAEAHEGDVLDRPQHLPHTEPRAQLARQIHLRDVARDNHLGAEAGAGQKHLHLLGRRVLRLVEDHEGVVERAPAHEGERGDLDHAALDVCGDPL